LPADSADDLEATLCKCDGDCLARSHPYGHEDLNTTESCITQRPTPDRLRGQVEPRSLTQVDDLRSEGGIERPHGVQFAASTMVESRQPSVDGRCDAFAMLNSEPGGHCNCSHDCQTPKVMPIPTPSPPLARSTGRVRATLRRGRTRGPPTGLPRLGWFLPIPVAVFERHWGCCLTTMHRRDRPKEWF